MKRPIASTLIALSLIGGVAEAQTFATSAQPYTAQPYTAQPVLSPYQPTQPASTVESVPTYSVPVYDAYEPTGFDASGYSAATQPPTVVDAPVYPEAVEYMPVTLDDGGITYRPPLEVTPTYTRAAPVQMPAQTAALDPDAAGFSAETETSRQLLALDDSYTARIAALKQDHLRQRRALLDGFSKEAEDPAKVIGLAERMRQGIAALDAAHAALLAQEEKQHMQATLRILDAAPSRIQ